MFFQETESEGDFFSVSNQQPQYSVFHKPMCRHSLTFRLPNVISPLQRGDLLYRVTGGGGGLNINCTDCPDRGHRGDPPLSGKNPHGRAEIFFFKVIVYSHTKHNNTYWQSQRPLKHNLPACRITAVAVWEGETVCVRHTHLTLSLSLTYFTDTQIHLCTDTDTLMHW
jgi:hypothetical protein